jgi:hypothetical protein
MSNRQSTQPSTIIPTQQQSPPPSLPPKLPPLILTPHQILINHAPTRSQRRRQLLQQILLEPLQRHGKNIQQTLESGVDGLGAVALCRRCPGAVHAFGEHEDGAVGARPCGGGALVGSLAVGGHDDDVEEGVDIAGTAGVGEEEAGVCWRGVLVGVFDWLVGWSIDY